jgi:hypothetical protein
MFAVADVGLISANHEQSFGLDNLIDKQLIMMYEIPKKMSTVLDQTIFQSMVSGEGVSVPRKNKKAITVECWKSPMIGAGNNLPDYNDNSGSIARRLAIFPFKTMLTTRNTSMKATIVRDELPTVLLRCVQKYRLATVEHKGKEFWSFAPEELRDAQKNTATDTNNLASFLENGDEKVQIIADPNSFTSLSSLKKHDMDYQKRMRIHPEPIGGDHFPIKAAGYKISKKNICKVTSCRSHQCHSTARAELCGDHYAGGRNRQKIWTIEGMAIKESNHGLFIRPVAWDAPEKYSVVTEETREAYETAQHTYSPNSYVIKTYPPGVELVNNLSQKQNVA